MKNKSCKGCVHDWPNTNDCRILLSRPAPEKECKSRMTKFQLLQAEKDIENYKFKLKEKG